jgi:hypothetical protein
MEINNDVKNDFTLYMYLKKTSNVKNVMSSNTLMDIFELLQWNDVEDLNLKKIRALHLHC